MAVRQAWLRSEPGLWAQDAFRRKCSLERRMKLIAKRAEAVEKVRIKALIARELGHQRLEAPTRTVGVSQFVRAMDGVTPAAIRRHSPEVQRRA